MMGRSMTREYMLDNEGRRLFFMLVWAILSKVYYVKDFFTHTHTHNTKHTRIPTMVYTHNITHTHTHTHTHSHTEWHVIFTGQPLE